MQATSLQRQIVVLAARHLDLLVLQHGEGAGDAAAGRVRRDHLVDIAALGGGERVAHGRRGPTVPNLTAGNSRG